MQTTEITGIPRATTFTNADLVSGRKIHPLKAVHTYDASDFETFIHEWMIGHLKKEGKYKSIYKLGGANDKGRDILAFVDANKTIVDYYQCKHYDAPLTPSDVWVEMGKLCVHTYTKQIPFPRKYYFLAPRDIGPKLSDLLQGDKDVLRQQLIKNWTKYCENSISSSSIPLDKPLLAYISKMDFDVFETKPILEIIQEHSGTVWAPFRFGGGLKMRSSVSETPSMIHIRENQYIHQLLLGYAQRIKKTILKVVDLLPYNKESSHLIRQRNAFYSAEHLRIHARESLPEEHDEFEKLKKDVFDGVINTVEKEYADPIEKVDAVVDRAMELPTEGNLLSGQIRTLDKHGVCHHLVNDGKIHWKL